MELEDKVAMATGTSAEIGAAIVKSFVKTWNEDNVVGIAIRKERIEQLSQTDDGKLIVLKIDLKSTEEILNGFKWIEKNLAIVHVLINNAATGIPTPVIEGKIDAWKSVMDTNFFSIALTCREAIRIMQEKNIQGYIINVNSVAGRYDVEGSIQGNVMYTSSKRALMTLMENIRLELARTGGKIRITSLVSGTVKTEIRQAIGLNKEESAKLYSQIPHSASEDIAVPFSIYFRLLGMFRFAST